MFKDIYSPTNPPPVAPRQQPGAGARVQRQRRTTIPAYRERLMTLHADDDLPYHRILDIMKTDFPNLLLSMSKLKRDLRDLGLRRWDNMGQGASSRSVHASQKPSPVRYGDRAGSGNYVEQEFNEPPPNFPSGTNMPEDNTNRDNIAISDFHAHNWRAEPEVYYYPGSEAVVPVTGSSDLPQHHPRDFMEELSPEFSYPFAVPSGDTPLWEEQEDQAAPAYYDGNLDSG